MDKLIEKLESDKIQITKGMGAREKDRSSVINKYIASLIEWVRSKNTSLG